MVKSALNFNFQFDNFPGTKIIAFFSVIYFNSCAISFKAMKVFINCFVIP